jgi:hypothetical protein
VYNLPGLSQLPQDVTISNDGNFASVRTVRLSPSTTTPSGSVYVWSLASNPPTLSLNGAAHLSAAEGGDSVHVFDDLVLSLAANVADDPVANELRIWRVAHGAATFLGAQSALGFDCWDAEVGYGGVAMGAIGAVRHRFGGISLWDLAAGAPLAPQATYLIPNLRLAVPACTGTPTDDVFGTADCIQMTSTRVVAIANSWTPNAPAQQRHSYWGGVGIAEFQGQPGWPKTFLTQPPVQIICPGASDPQQYASYYFVHDLAISPDGSKATVSGTDWIGVYNINRGTEIGTLSGTQYPTPTFLAAPLSRATLDSVEMTDTRAVVIGNAFRWNVPFNNYMLPTYNNTSPNDGESFEICVLSFDSNGILQDRVWNTAALLPNLPAPLRARACDLGITPNKSKAIVSTRRATIVFALKDDPLAMVPQVVMTTADPLDFNPGEAEPSDVVACTDTRAVVIGRRPKAGAPTTTMEGVVDVLDLMPPQLVPPAPPVLAGILSTVVIGDFYIPTDVVVTPDGTRAIVRSNRPGVAINTVDASRITVIELLGGTVEFQTDSSHGALGVARGTDHLECSNEWVVSAGETSLSACSVQFLRLP